MSIIARLGVILGINTAEFNKGLDDATKKTKDFERNQKQALKNAQQAQDEFMATAAKGLAGVAAAALLVGQAFKYADDIEDTAAAFDVTTQALLALKAALQGAGGDANNIGTALQKLASAQQDAKDGSEQMREAFDKLEISGKDVEKLSLEDMFKRVAQELAKVENTTERAALQQQLLGKAMKGVDVRTFVDKYKEMGDPALLSAIQENAKAWENIETAFKNILLFAQKLVSPLAAIVNSMADIAGTMDHLSKGGSTEIDWGASELGGMPGTAITHGYGAAPGGKKTPIAPAAKEGGYSTQTDKQKSAAKKAADDYQKVADKQKEIAALIEKINASTKQNVDLISKQYLIDTQLLDLEMNQHLMSENTYDVKKKTLEQTKELQNLTASYLKFETDAREELKKASKDDAKFAKQTYDAKMQQAGTEYALKFTNLKSLQEKEIEVIKNASAIRRQYEKEDRDIAYLNQMIAIDLQYKAVYENLKLEDQAFLLSTDSFNLLKMKLSVIGQIAQIEEEYSVKELAIKTEFARKSEEERRSSLGQYQEQLKNLENLKERELEYLDAIQNKREENYINEIARQQSWTAGWLDASKQYFEAMEKASIRGANAFNSMMGNMNSALSNFVNTGKISFEDLTASIIRDLIRIELQAQASKMFGMIWNSISGFFGSTTGSTPAYTANVAFGKKASGGGINAPTIVGENGAELFVPNTPGTIIPNGSWQQAAAGMGGSGFTNNGTYIANMSAIDTQSATQFLASNKNTIWAVYQSANRSVPISR
jgi:lambda family phage tail tape measure protein